MSGKRKTLSRYNKNKNDTTRKKRTKISDSRFKRSSNKAITKQIGGSGTAHFHSTHNDNDILRLKIFLDDYIYAFLMN
jgi:hypothetical protein